MEINLNHKQLSNLAQSAASEIVTVLNSGFVTIDYTQMKPLAKTMLWVSQATPEDIESVPQNLPLEDLYFELEDKNAFFVEKKDLPKYKYFMEQVESFVKDYEAKNRALTSNAVVSIATNLLELANLMSALDTDKIQEQTVDILKNMLNQ